MKGYKKYFFIRLVSAVCTAAVLLASVPHHHHNDSIAVCFNILHCLNDQGCHPQDGGRGHTRDCGHHSSEPSGCHLKIDAAEILKQDVKIFQPPAAILPNQPDGRIIMEDLPSGRYYYNIVPPFRDLYTDFVARALRPRAPSFLA